MLSSNGPLCARPSIREAERKARMNRGCVRTAYPAPFFWEVPSNWAATCDMVKLVIFVEGVQLANFVRQRKIWGAFGKLSSAVRDRFPIRPPGHAAQQEEPRAKKYDTWDDKVSGPALRVGTSGHRAFFLRRTVRGAFARLSDSRGIKHTEQRPRASHIVHFGGNTPLTVAASVSRNSP